MKDFMTEYLPIINKFDIKGEVVSVAPYGEGHINSTMLVTTDEKRYMPPSYPSK